MLQKKSIEIDSRISDGNFGENLVEEFLLNKGYKILSRNYKKRFGEIDLIAQYKNYIIFVEVKLRKTEYFYLSEVITPSKQRKIILTAKYFIKENKFVDKIYRFDVALVLKEGDNFKINYIENAFVENNEKCFY